MKSAIYTTKVVATKKAINSRKGSFWAQLAALASKPVTLDHVINAVAASPMGTRAKRKPAQRVRVARCRVRQAFTRFGYLRKA